MAAGPKPSNFVASIIALLMVIGVLLFIAGIGSGALKFQDPQFNLIAGFLFGAVGGVLAFYYGSTTQSERKTELLAEPTTLAPRVPWTQAQRDAMKAATTPPTNTGA